MVKIKETIRNRDLKPIFDLIIKYEGRVPFYELMIAYLKCVTELEEGDPDFEEMDVNLTKQIFETAIRKFNIFEFANFFANMVMGNQTEIHQS